MSDLEINHTPVPVRWCRTAVVWFSAMAVLVALAPSSLPAVASGPASASTAERRTFSGSASGTSVSLGSSVSAADSAPLTFGCTRLAPWHLAGTSVGRSQSPLVTTGTVNTTGDTAVSPVRSRTSATTSAVNLLGGLVTAASVTAVSTTTATSTGLTTSAAGSVVTGLVVDGVPVSQVTAPDTRIHLPGFGYLVVDERVASASGLTVSGMRLVVDRTNELRVAPGTTVVVSRAVSALTAPVLEVLGGHAYGTHVRRLGEVLSADSYRLNVPCLGTRGARRTRTGAGAELAGALRSGPVTTSVQGLLTSTSWVSKSTSSVESVDLLDGLVRATAVTSEARVERTGSTTYTKTINRRHFGTLSVRGFPDINARVAPNTTVVIPHVGTLYLNREFRYTKSVYVVPIELVLHDQVGPYAPWTDIAVAEVRAGVS